MKHLYNDGGRKALGLSVNRVGDCVARAIAIASQKPYQEVYDALAVGNETQRLTKRSSRRGAAGKRTASHGILVNRKWFKDYMQELGFRWVATMGIGTGCRVHLHDGELPMGRLVVSVSKHYTAVIDGVIHDTHDPQRTVHNMDGTISRRCVYGYWIKE